MVHAIMITTMGLETKSPLKNVAEQIIWTEEKWYSIFPICRVYLTKTYRNCNV